MNLTYIYWNPDIVVVDLGFFALRWYSVFFASGFLFSYLLLKKKMISEEFSDEKLEKLTIYGVTSAVAGARLGHCLFYDFDYYSQHIAEIFLPFSFDPVFQFTGYMGLASHGGTAALLAALVVFTKKYNVKLLWLLDELALVAPLAGCMIRLGNLMNSEMIGTPTNVRWAFVFEQVDNLPRHPSQLYEAIGYLGIFIFMNVLAKKVNKQDGFIFGLFLTLLFSARFVIEFIKIDQTAFEAGMLINMGQLLSIPFILAGLVLLVLRGGDESIITEKHHPDRS